MLDSVYLAKMLERDRWQMSNQLRVGLVGVGQRGLNHLQNLVRLQGEEVGTLSALADPFADNLNPSKIKQYESNYDDRGVALFEDADAMITSGEVDVIWFAMPPNQHRGEIERAAEAGIAIFAEKPQTLYFDEALSQSEAIDKAGVPNTVGFQMRFHPVYKSIRDHLFDKWTAAMMMVAEGAVEGHGVKHTHTEERGGPANRIWTANQAWSGTSMVEAGIHQTDIMRYWSDDDVEWVRASYVDRPSELWDTEGDNPIYYNVTYGFKKGAIGTLVFTKPARSYYQGRFDCIIWEHGTIKLEDGCAVDYHYSGDDWSPALRPGLDDTRRVLCDAPGFDGMSMNNSYELAKTFLESVIDSDISKTRNSYESSLNSLAAVLAANTSNRLGGARVDIAEFMYADKYAVYRQRPANL